MQFSSVQFSSVQFSSACTQAFPLLCRLPRDCARLIFGALLAAFVWVGSYSLQLEGPAAARTKNGGLGILSKRSPSTRVEGGRYSSHRRPLPPKHKIPSRLWNSNVPPVDDAYKTDPHV